MDRPYHYKPLEGSRTIRLLRLPEGWIFQGCGCADPWTDWDFVDVSLDSHPPYLAISYVWGDPTPSATLRGKPGNLPLTRNASLLLGHICAQYATPLHIWIDALCIDQQNLVEKRVQLPLMKEIYREAVQVIAWLGNQPLHAMIRGSIDSPSSLPDAMDMITSYAKEKNKRKTPQIAAEDLEGTCQCQRDKGRSVLFTLHKLISQEWFHRIWVFQEVVCGSCIVITYSYENRVKELLWDDLYVYLLDYNLLHFGSDNQSYGGSSVCVMAARRYLQQYSTPGVSLQTLLTDTASFFEATDPRDRIYALVGLSNDVAFQDLRPAYVDSVEAVFAEVAILLLTLRQELNPFPFALLSFAGIGRPRNLETLPSWVPDWTSAAHRLCFRANSVVVEETHLEKVADRATFDATWGATYTTPTIRTLYGSTVLSVTGLIIDTVEAVGHRYPGAKTLPPGILKSSTGPDNNVAQCKAWVIECKTLAASIPPYPTGESAEEVLWRTLIADLRQDFQPWSFVHGHTCLPSDNEYETFFAQISGELSGAESIRAPGRCRNFVASFEMHGAGRVLFTTEGGLLGLGPDGMAVGDQLCLLPGARVPFLLRKSEKLRAVPSWNLVGECYVRGIMHGERFNEEDKQVIRMI